MSATKAHIISQLRKDILLLQGFKAADGNEQDAGLSLIKDAFPNAVFPTTAIHEFFSLNHQDTTATCGFIAGILSSLAKGGKAVIWVSSSPITFPPALKHFGLEPHNVIFIHPKREREKLYVIEEALKCDAVSSVVGEIAEVSFTESRRFQLAVEETRVTGFLVRQNAKNLTTACAARWQIKSIQTDDTGLPGLAYPRWQVELMKVKNGKPGCWQMEWMQGKFRLINQPVLTVNTPLRKIG